MRAVIDGRALSPMLGPMRVDTTNTADMADMADMTDIANMAGMTGMADMITSADRMRARLDAHGLVVESADLGEYLRWDAEGRWVVARRANVEWRRSVVGDVYERRGRESRRLGDDDARAFTDRVAARAREMADGFRGTHGCTGANGDAVVAALERAARWRGDALAEHRRRAAAVYPDGLPILPPHRARDLVVEPARGCPNAQCSFCAFYRGRRLAVLDDAQFAAHLDDVLALWGSCATAREGIFLGAASAASLPDAIFSRRVKQVRERWGSPRRGVAAFLDPDHAPRRTTAAWARLLDAGLADLTVGLETGLAPLRRSVGKSADVAAFERSVRSAKAAGLRVSVSVLVGLGGSAVAASHRIATCAAVSRLDLDRQDLVYLSPLAGSTASEALAAEERPWREALALATTARVARYAADGFVAWA